MSHFSAVESQAVKPGVRLIGLTGARSRARELTAWELVAERALTIANIAAFISGLLVIADVETVLRPWMAAILVVLGPGSGMVQVIGRFETATRWMLVPALSIACAVLTAEVLLSINRLNLEPAAITLTALTALGLVVSIRNVATRKY